MKTNFFTTLKEFGSAQYSIAITYAKNENQMTISLLPTHTNKDESIASLKPLTITATPEELDEKYFATISEPVNQTLGFIDNSVAYLEQKKQAEELSQKEKDKKIKLEKLIADLKGLIENPDEMKNNIGKIKSLVGEIKLIAPSNSIIAKAESLLAASGYSQKALF